MLFSQNRLLALVGLLFAGKISATPQRPYAPDLYDRAALTTDSEHHRRSLPDLARPYAPDLFMRDALKELNEEDFSLQPSPTVTGFVKRSASNEAQVKSRGICRRDADCSASHFCSSGNCQAKRAKRALCSRDSMCGSGFCGSSGACLEKRSVGAGCSNNDNACVEGLFCSTSTNTCKEKRTINGSCRSDSGCGDGLQCLNFKCLAKSIHQKIDEISHQAWGSHKPPHFPFPSGSPWDKRQFFPSDRSDAAHGSGNSKSHQSGSASHFREPEKKGPTGSHGPHQPHHHDTDEHFWHPSPSGSFWDKRTLVQP